MTILAGCGRTDDASKSGEDISSFMEDYRSAVSSSDYIVHALGGEEDRSYINSIDMLDKAYKEGLRVFEADISFTSDGVLVLAHSGEDNVWSKNDWEKRLGQKYPFDDESVKDYECYDADKHLCSYEVFNSFKIQGRYTANSFAELLDYMEEHRDMYLMVDAGHRSYADTQVYYEAIVEAADGRTQVLDRLIAGGQTTDMVKAAREVYDFPLINLYFDMKCDLAGRYVLLGALLARARQLRDVDPTVHARVYTMVHPEDTDSQAFYTSSGMSLEQRESLVTLQVPQGESRLPMGCQVIAVPMNTPEEKLGFLSRLNNNDIRHVDFVLLQQFMRTSHFQILGLTRENSVVAELMMVGNGNSAELMAIYTYPTCRGQGLAKALLHRSMVILQSEGVSHFEARIMTRSKPQMGLANAFGAQEEEVISLFPELML